MQHCPDIRSCTPNPQNWHIIFSKSFKLIGMISRRSGQVGGRLHCDQVVLYTHTCHTGAVPPMQHCPVIFSWTPGPPNLHIMSWEPYKSIGTISRRSGQVGGRLGIEMSLCVFSSWQELTIWQPALPCHFFMDTWHSKLAHHVLRAIQFYWDHFQEVRTSGWKAGNWNVLVCI